MIAKKINISNLQQRKRRLYEVRDTNCLTCSALLIETNGAHVNHFLSTAVYSAAENGDDENGDMHNSEQLNGESHSTSQPQPFGLPLSLVRKIACMDSEVQRLSSDAARCISKATAIFIEFLAVKSLEKASTFKRKNLKFSDIQAAASHDRRLRDMGLPEFLREDEVFQEIHSGTGKEGKEGKAEMSETAHKGEKENANKQKPLNLRAMTDFYNFT